MPHIIVEYSQGLKSAFSIASMLKDLHNSIDGMHGVTLDRIKTRAHAAEDFLVGEDDQFAGFVHIDLRLMPGRTDEQRRELSEALLKAAKPHLVKRVALTIETSELHGPSYQS